MKGKLVPLFLHTHPALTDTLIIPILDDPQPFSLFITIFSKTRSTLKNATFFVQKYLMKVKKVSSIYESFRNLLHPEAATGGVL